MFIEMIFVGAGGFLGSIMRFLTGKLVAASIPSTFPLGTLTVNVLGCLIIGALATLIERNGIMTPNQRLMIITGFLGSLTTFSTFSLETTKLFRDQHSGLAIINVVVSLILCIGAVLLGRYAVGLISGK